MLASIVLATFIGGAVSILAAAAISMALLKRWAPRLVGFAVGALLGAALLNLLPEAIESDADTRAILATVLGGLMLFFVLEKLALWRHAHVGGDHHHGDGSGEAQVHAGADHPERTSRPAAIMVLIGDGLHNFVDGILIAGAFLTDPALGWASAIAVIAHEIPQEVGDFSVLLDAGYSRARALAMNGLSGLASVAGGVAGYFALSELSSVVPFVLALAASSFLYIAVADLVPNLHRRVAGRDAVSQVILIGLGVAAVAIAGQGH